MLETPDGTLRHGSSAPVQRTMASRLAAPLPALFLLLTGVELVAAACSNVTTFSTQLDTLLAEYDRATAPSPRVQVDLTLDVHHATVLERTSSVRMLADLQMNWDDKRVSWNSSDWGCDSALVPAERLWLPDVVLVSAATQGEVESQRAHVSSRGRVAWTSRLDLSAPVALRLENWPRDVHSITFKFASRDHDSDQLVLTISNVERVLVFESGGWELVGMSRSEGTWQSGGRERQLATWTLALQRRAPAHALATGAVLAGTTFLMLTAMILPPSRRPPLYACASFTAALWLISALVRLPGSATSPRCLVSLGALCACGGVAALCAALVGRVASVRSTPPRQLRACVAAASALCSLTPESTSNEERGAWVAAAQLLDYVLLALLVLAIFVIICLYL